jgi:beta-lactamase class D
MKIRVLIVLVVSLAITASAFSEERSIVDYSRYFGDYDGAFLLYNVKADSLLMYNPKQCDKRISPWATYDMLCALIVLETRNARDETFVLRWDGTKYSDESWNRNHTLESAMQNSVNWYFQELVRTMGAMRMESFMNRLNYGNNDIIGGLDCFWMGSSLKISAFEQMQFLHALYDGQLPFSRLSMDTVKKIFTLEKTDSYVLKGKEGPALRDAKDRFAVKGNFSWFIGWVERDGNGYIFVTSIKGKKGATGSAAKEITLRILKESGIL